MPVTRGGAPDGLAGQSESSFFGQRNPKQVERGLRPWPRDEYLKLGTAADLISIKYTRREC
jgi:hypothetical protein